MSQRQISSLAIAMVLAITNSPSSAIAADRQVAVRTPGSAKQIAIHESWLYVADGRSGISSVELKTDGSTLKASHLAPAGNAVDLARSELILYIADYDYGLLILDISSQPPVEAARIPLQGSSAGLSSSGGACAVASRQAGISIIGRNDEGEFVLQSRLNLPDVHDVVMSKDTIFAADTMKGLVIIDASNVAAPRVQAMTELPCLNPAVGLCNPIAITLHKQRAYLGTGEGVAIFNVSNREMPQYLETLPAGVVGSLAIVDEKLYIRNYDDGVDYVTEYQLSDQAAPELSSRCAITIESLDHGSLSIHEESLYLLANDVYEWPLQGFDCQEFKNPSHRSTGPGF